MLELGCASGMCSYIPKCSVLHGYCSECKYSQTFQQLESKTSKYTTFPLLLVGVSLLTVVAVRMDKGGIVGEFGLTTGNEEIE